MLMWIAVLVGAFLLAWFVMRVLCVPYLAKKQALVGGIRRELQQTVQAMANMQSDYMDRVEELEAEVEELEAKVRGRLGQDKPLAATNAPACDEESPLEYVRRREGLSSTGREEGHND